MTIVPERLFLYNPEDGGTYVLLYASDGHRTFFGEIVGTRPDGIDVRRPDLAGKKVEFVNLDHPEKITLDFPDDVQSFGSTQIDREPLSNFYNEIVLQDRLTNLKFNIFTDKNGKIIHALMPVKSNLRNRFCPYNVGKTLDNRLKLSVSSAFFKDCEFSGHSRDGQFVTVAYGTEGLKKRPEIIVADDQYGRNLKLLSYRDEYKHKAEPSTKLQELISQASELPGIGDRMEIIDSIVAAVRSKRVDEILFGENPEGNDHPLLGNIIQDFGHVAFIGNPGTLKTIFVEIMYEALKAEGYITGPLIRINGREIVQGYIGQTETAMKAVIDHAVKNNALVFLDEFHALDDTGMGGKGKEYGANAARMLIAAMENHRDEFYVAFAGYPAEMKKAIKNIDPGLKDRITSIFTLDDYTPEQLEDIFYYLLPERFTLDDDAKRLVTQKIEAAYEGRDKTFGNGRVMRKMVQSIVNSSKLRHHQEGFYDKILEAADNNRLTPEFLEKSRATMGRITLDDVMRVDLDVLDKIGEDFDGEYKDGKPKMGFDISRFEEESAKETPGVDISREEDDETSEEDDELLKRLKEIVSIGDKANDNRKDVGGDDTDDEDEDRDEDNENENDDEENKPSKRRGPKDSKRRRLRM